MYEIAEFTPGNDVMIDMGSDFQFANAHTWYKQLDKLIKHVNEDGRLNAFYSTPSQYLAAKMASNITFTRKTDDFFPYADCPNCMWSGYFTSRPTVKRYVRKMSHYLQFARQLQVWTRKDGNSLQQFWEDQSVAQHHDAVSGTEKQHVANDYVQRISRGENAASTEAMQTLSTLMSGAPFNLPLQECRALNESSCLLSQTTPQFAVVAYNTRAVPQPHLFKIPVDTPMTVVDYQGKPVVSQVLTNLPTIVPYTNPSKFYVVFEAQLPPLGYTTFVLSALPAAEVTPAVPAKPQADTVLENPALRLTFDSTSGLLREVLNKESGVSSAVRQSWQYYESYNNPPPSNPDDRQRSGAYIFRPQDEVARPACPGVPVLSVAQGSVVQEVRQQFCGWVQQTVRLVGNESTIQFEYQIGSVPVVDAGGIETGKEVISRFETDLNSNQTWYTDSNGREFIRRQYNHRDTWDYLVYQNVSGNYAPVNAALYQTDVTNGRVMSIVNDRSQGGGSIKNGELELMVHRRLVGDDSRGVGEPLNETASITPYPNPLRVGVGIGVIGHHYLHLGNTSNGAAHYRERMDRVFNEPVLGFAPVTNVQQFLAAYTTRASVSGSPLPPNVELMTLQPWGNGQVLIRVSHQYAVGEDVQLSKAVTFDLAQVFAGPLAMASATEMTLTANQKLSQAQARAKFPLRFEGQDATLYAKHRGKPTEITMLDPPVEGRAIRVSVTLGPMEIKTFLVTFA